MTTAAHSQDVMHPFDDLSDLPTIMDLVDELRRLRAAIRQHRDGYGAGEERDATLYSILPETRRATP